MIEENKYNHHNPLKIGYFADGIWSHNAFRKLIADKDISIQFICVRFDTKDNTLYQFAKENKIDGGQLLSAPCFIAMIFALKKDMT